MRLATLIGVFDDDTKPHLAVVIIDLAHDPDARSTHLDDDIGTLGGSESHDIDRGRSRHRIAVERKHREPVPWKREPDVLRCARIQQAKQDALAFADANRFPVTEHPVVEGCGGIHDLEAVIRRWPFAKVLHTDPTALPMVRGEQHLLS